jgi:probable HAF family extracellular repeat protein
MFQSGIATGFTIPGSPAFAARGVNCGGHTVGYMVTPDNAIVGFLRTADATVTPIYAPGAAYTFANGINNKGVIVGTCWDASYASHGFYLKAGTMTRFDVLGATGTELNGISGNGRAIGNYYDSAGIHPFVVKKNGKVTNIVIPGALAAIGYGLNNRGQRVGSYIDANHRVHGFILKKKKLTTIDYTQWPSTMVLPSGSFGPLGYVLRDYGTDVRGINQRGDIVGRAFANYFNADTNIVQTVYTGYTGMQKSGGKHDDDDDDNDDDDDD